MKRWRETEAYRKWRKAVIARDGKCVICGTTKDLEVHHINHASYFPNERFDINNGVTLCYNDHMDFHCNFKRSYRQKCTKYDFDNFKVLVKHLKTRICKEGVNNETKN